MTSQNIIRIKNAVFYAYHGADKDEQRLGGKFEVDIDMLTNFSRAIETDSLKDTIDYETVYAQIKDIINGKKYFLLETLAQNIADSILRTHKGVNHVTVLLRKPHPPVKGVVDYVEIVVSRERN